MELTELENIIKGYDRKMDENITLNREVLKRLLSNKPRRHLQLERVRALYQLSSPLLLPCFIAVIMEVMNIRISLTPNLYIGLGLFVPTFLFVWSLNFRHYLLIRRIDLSAPVILIKKQVAELERYNIRMTKMRNVLMPVLIAGMLLIFIPQGVYIVEFALMLVLVVTVFVLSAFYRNYAVKERCRVLNMEIEELEGLAK